MSVQEYKHTQRQTGRQAGRQTDRERCFPDELATSPPPGKGRNSRTQIRKAL